MPFYLRHFFDPDHDHTRLKPKELEDGSVDHYDLGFVQNVVIGQVLAEVVTIDDTPTEELDSRFIMEEETLPVGRNTEPNPANPRQLIATANGYATYDQELIAVKKVLTVHGDVNFHTGNILFVGDLVVNRSVRSGFSIQARNVLIKGHIGGAEVTAQESLAVESGVKGERQAVINAGKSIRLPFCENATLLAKENILINGVCMHSVLYVGKQLAIKGKLIGGAAYCRSVVYVQEQLGGGSATSTEIVMGYDPFLLRKSELIDEQIEDLEDTLEDMKGQAAKFAAKEFELRPKIIALEKKMQALLGQKIRIWDLIKERDTSNKCGIVVPGTVHSGVVLRIGEATMAVRESMENVRFTLADGEIKVSSPAMTSK